MDENAGVSKFGRGTSLDPSDYQVKPPIPASKWDVFKNKLGLDLKLPPVYWARRYCEYWADKPKHSWTLGGLFTKNKFVVFPMSRGARLMERIMMAKGLWMAAPIILAHPLALPVVIPLILSAKVDALCVGAVFQVASKFAGFVTGLFDEALNGNDAVRAQKREQLGIPPRPVTQPSPIARLIAKGNTGSTPTGQFNQQAAKQQPADPYSLGTIWGPGTGNAPQPGNGQTYEEPFTVPSEDQKWVASEGRESAYQHKHHVGEGHKSP
jgi:hypothetical protein